MQNSEFFRYETATRYYEIRVGVDLLGDTTLETTYGGKRNKLGRRSVIATGSDVQNCLEMIHKKRTSRKYILKVHGTLPRPSMP